MYNLIANVAYVCRMQTGMIAIQGWIQGVIAPQKGEEVLFDILKN